ncbi:hypothetical protein Bca4012_031426 [Brassica carinata]|nr:unnamed protein product [Brassica napus]
MKVGPVGGLAELVVDEADGPKARNLRLHVRGEDGKGDEIVIALTLVNEPDLVCSVSFCNALKDIYWQEKSTWKKEKQLKSSFPQFITNLEDKNMGQGSNSRANEVSQRSRVLWTGRVIRYDMKKKEATVNMGQGSNSRANEVFTKIPGPMDNIRRTPMGDLRVALHSKDSLFTRLFRSHSLVEKFFHQDVEGGECDSSH